MMVDMAQEAERKPLAQRLAENAYGVLEQIAREYGVSTLEVARNLPPAHCTIVDAAHFGNVMEDVTAWGGILFIVHTPDIVVECKGMLPPGSFGRGHYIHGESPIGGHIRAENCEKIAFVARPFMGRESRSIQFFNAAGEATRYSSRAMPRASSSEQIAKFDALRARFEAVGS